MFGKKTEQNTGSVNTRTSVASHNSLVQGSRLEGNVTSENDFRIDGQFIGNLQCKSRVIIGPSGDFQGQVNCENAIIEGRFSGTLVSHDVLEVREGAIIEGDVNTRRLVVQSGSVFDVKCNMGTVDNVAGFIAEPSLVEEGVNGKIE